MNTANLMLILSSSFVQRALITGLMLSLSMALLGSILVFKRFSLIGDGLSHIGFATVSIAAALSWPPLIISIPIMVAAAILIMLITEQKGMYADTMIGIIANSSLAVGMIVAVMNQGFNTDVANFFFGSILAITPSDMLASIALTLVVILVFIWLHHQFFLITHDETYARSRGLNIIFYKVVLATLTGLTISLGLRLTGSLLISSLIIFPVTIARKVAKNYKTLLFLGCIISLFSFSFGIFISSWINIPTGAAIVIINLCLLLITSLIKK
jgi:ABC-type Mn2+/Zn2+ transport system permease subunit